MRQTRFRYLAGAIGVLAIATMAFVPPIAQDTAYHGFSDNRTLFGVPNFWNVISNLPFVAAGIAGLWDLRRFRPPHRWEWYAYAALFTGILATTFGSGYYHLAPDNGTLFWDRLPMAVAFMALFALVIGERTAPEAGRLLLAPLLAAGVASVAWWRAYDDLRFYVLVQFVPLVVTPWLLITAPARYAGVRQLVIALLFYAAAKLLELLDTQLMAILGFWSGHTLKHLAAGLSAWWLVRWMRARSPLPYHEQRNEARR